MINYFKYNVNEKSEEQIINDSKLKRAQAIYDVAFDPEEFVVYDLKKLLIENENVALYLAEDTDKKKPLLVGMCLVMLPNKKKEMDIMDFLCQDSQKYDAPYISALVIDEDYRGRGIGKKLFKFANDDLKDYERVSLNVDAKNLTALNLYKNEGFLISNFELYDGDKAYFMLKFKDDENKKLSDIYYNLLQKVMNKVPTSELVKSFKDLENDKSIKNQELLQLIESSVLEFKQIKVRNKQTGFNIKEYLGCVEHSVRFSENIKPMLKAKKVYRKLNKEGKEKFAHISKMTCVLYANDNISNNKVGSRYTYDEFSK